MELWPVLRCGHANSTRIKKKPAENATVCEFPRHTIGGLAGEFADLYSEYLESPWSFFAFFIPNLLGRYHCDKVTLASEISPQPRLYTVNLGESGDDRKSESIKKTLEFFESTMARGELESAMGSGPLKAWPRGWKR